MTRLLAAAIILAVAVASTLPVIDWTWSAAKIFGNRFG
jgi:hypothetical protein